jgi:ubiquinone/menaquinone biosynthesis C-methylase UbiE
MESANSDLWQAYSRVYALMENVSFVKAQRARHVDALKGLNRILDAGCGIGLVTVELAKDTERRVLAIDNDPAMLRVAKRRLLRAGRSQGVILTRGDVGSVPCAGGTVEGYLSNNVLYCVANEQAVLEEMSRVVGPGGRACIASARPSMNVDVLLDAMEAEFREFHDPRLRECFRKFATVNRSLRSLLKNLHEPDEFARRLEHSGRWRVLEATTTYLEQSYFVVSMRV